MEENSPRESGWFGARCWGGTPSGQCPCLGIDAIERASFRLIKWVTASGCRIEDMDPLRRKKASWKKRKHRGTPQISLARGRDSIESEWVNWKMWPSFCEWQRIWVWFGVHIFADVHLCLCGYTQYIFSWEQRESFASLDFVYLICKDVCGYLWCVHKYTCVYVCVHVNIYICVCVCTRLVGRNRLIPPELRHCWNLATGARGLPPQRGWLPRHIHYQPRILGWIKNSCCLQQQKAPR